jgi:glucan biosynthesis protein
MAKKAINYDNLTWSDQEADGVATQPVAAAESEEGRGGEPESQLLRDVAAQTMLYLDFEAVRMLDEQALARSTLKYKMKRHDLIIEALEEWAEKRGIKTNFRAKPRHRRA